MIFTKESERVSPIVDGVAFSILDVNNTGPLSGSFVFKIEKYTLCRH